MRVLPAILLALSGGFASALLLPPATAQHGARAPLGEADSGQTIHAPIGTVLSVALTHAAGSGYAWRYVARDGILPVDARTASAAAPGAVGGPVVQSFQFRTVAPRATIAFALARPWEKDRPPVKMVRYVVVPG